MSSSENNKLFVLLVAPFKTGTWYVEKVLSDNNVPHVRLHAYDAAERKKYPHEMVTHFITIKRASKLELYISAWYMDAHQAPYYPYSYASTREEFNAAPTADLVKHFCSQQWESYRWLNYEYYQAWARWFERRGKPALELTTETISEEMAEKLPTFLYPVHSAKGDDQEAAAKRKLLAIDKRPSHVTAQGPNGGRYLELKAAILEAMKPTPDWKKIV